MKKTGMTRAAHGVPQKLLPILCLSVFVSGLAWGATTISINQPFTQSLYGNSVSGNPNQPVAGELPSDSLLTSRRELNITADGTLAAGSGIWGGYGDSATPPATFEVQNSRVSIGASGGSAITITGGDIYGGQSVNGMAGGNEVVISNSTIGALGANVKIYGSHSYMNTNNSLVTIDANSTLYAEIYGAYSSSGDVTDSGVTIKGGSTVHGDVYGGYAKLGDAINNTIDLTDGTVENVFGGFSEDASKDSFTANKMTKYAAATVSGRVSHMQRITFADSGNAGIAELDVTAYVGTGGAVSTEVELDTGANTITFDGNIIEAGASGGINKTGTGVLELTGSGNTYTGTTMVSEGTLKGNIPDNAVLTLVGAASIYDGAGVARRLSNLYGFGTISNTAGLAIASGNFPGNIDNSNSSLTKISDGTATGGTLVLSGNNAIQGWVIVNGGTLKLEGPLASRLLELQSGGIFDNTFGRHSLQGGSLTATVNTQYLGDLDAKNAALNFYLPANANSGDVLLRVSGNADIDGSTVNILVPGNVDLQNITSNGQYVDLLVAQGGVAGNPQGTVTIYKGLTEQYIFDLSSVDGANTGQLDTLRAMLNNTLHGPLNPSTGGNPTVAISEGWLGGALLVQQAAEMVAGDALRDAVQASRTNEGWNVFGLISGGKSKYKTGSHVDLHNVAAVAGVSYSNIITHGTLTTGAFIEYGNGSYDTNNDFGGVKVQGDGDTDYIGGGLLARFEAEGNETGFGYLEASLRAGRINNDFSSDDLITGLAVSNKFDSKATYYGAHLGAGYVWNVSDKMALDFYGKVLWARVGSDTVTMMGDTVKLDSVDALRSSLGVRYSYFATSSAAPYIGLAYEHSFGAEATASINGKAIANAPEYKGGSGKLEVGVTMTPDEDKTWYIDLGLQGYAGKREGVTGSLMIRHSF